MMKKIYVAVLLMLSMQSMSMYAAQDSLQDAEDIMTQHMKDIFLQTLDTAIKEIKNLDQFHDPVFLYVMQHKNDHMIRDLLYEWGEIEDKNGSTPLHDAADWNNIEIARMLIDAHADLNIQNKNGQTPLHNAAEMKNTGIARMLIDARADLNIQDKNGRTPLHNAADWNDAEIAKMLIDAGADVNIQNKYGKKAELAARTPEMREVFAPAREKQQEKVDVRAIARFKK